MSSTPSTLRPPSTALILAVLTLAAIVGACSIPAGGDLGTVALPGPTGDASLEVPSSEPTPAGPSIGPGSTPAGTPTASPAATTTVRAYFMLGSHTGSGGLTPVLRTIPKTQAVGAASMAALLAGPVAGELSADPAMFTDIPVDTRFLGLSISNGVATVNLSSEFAAGGTSATIEQRYGQVVFTLTQFATIKGVRFQLDASDAPAITDAGPVSRTVTRSDYVALIPKIFVDSPAWGGAVANPARFTGMAYAFEAQFRLQLSAADDTTLVDVAVTATCGSGCWGTFDVTVPYTVATAQWGTLRVFELSAADSHPINVTEYPVWLTPRG